MSHALDRMIWRTRTATPAVEPLYQPRYQPRARAYPEMPVPLEARESFLDESPESAEFVGTISHTAGARSRMGVAADPATPIEPNRPLQIFEAGGPALSAVERDGKAAAPRTPDSHPLSGLREGIEAREIGAPDLAGETKRGGDRARNTHASSQIAPRAESRAFPALESARPSARRASETAAQNSPEAPLDITISIGHIEVRSPQVIERPRKPTFRPKTSLADFLKPRQGSARE